MHPDVRYNTEAKIGAVGSSIWGKLSPERWLTNYKVVCTNARGFRADFVIDLGLQPKKNGEFTTQQAVIAPQFRALANGMLAGYRFVVYAPVDAPISLGADSFVVNNPIISKQFEDKRKFRELFSNLITIPKHRMLSFAELEIIGPKQAYARLIAEFGEPLVLQESTGAGGRGTFVLRSVADMADALHMLREEQWDGTCIISQFIAGTERSMQAFVSADALICGPVQQQLLKNPELQNAARRGGMNFCGGRLAGAETPAAVRVQMKRAMTVIGERMRRAGYRGIFGVDFLLDDMGVAHALEINARPTGMQPLLKEQNERLPLYLLHVLELAGEPYEITAPAVGDSVSGDGPDSLLILFNQQSIPVCFDSQITTGNYRITGDAMEKIDDSPHWNSRADVMLQLFCSPSFPAQPDLKLCNIFLRGGGFNNAGELHPEARHALALLRDHIAA